MFVHFSPDDSTGRFESGQSSYQQQADRTNGSLVQSQNLNNSDIPGQQQPKRGGRGFASMDPARVSQIASMGGRAAHEQGVAHEWTPEEARAAGRKGGQASHGGNRPGRSTDQTDDTGI